MTVHLSKRALNILLLLLDLENSITTKELADNFNVSVRTIKYDLESIKEWVQLHDEKLCSRRNKGVWLEVTESKRLTLKNEIMDVERFETYPDQSRRVNHLIFYLLSVKEFVTTQQLAGELLVSRNTIVSDLDQVDVLLKAYDLALIRQARQGFAIKGSESNVRLLMEFITQKEITEYDIYQIMNYIVQTDEQKKCHEVNIGSGTLFKTCYQTALNQMMYLLNPSSQSQFNYAEILAITIRVAIAASRMQMGHTIGTYKILTNQNVLEQNHEIPFLLMKRVFEEYELPLLADEYFYVYSDIFVANNRQDIVQLTEELIENVSSKLAFPFYNDRQLFTNLFAHLSLRLTKKHLFVNEYNPFVDDIKGKHATLFDAIYQASKEHISGSALLINDSFIAYIALHFLVAYERNQQATNLVRIVYVCSTGLGVTSLIEQKISEEIANVEIAGFASVLNATSVIEKENPDLVVSIFPIEEVQCPFVKVNPLLTATDLTLIQEEVSKLLEAKKNCQSPLLIPRTESKETQGIESESRELLVKAYIVYEELLKVFSESLIEEYREAFLLHVMLMIHRITFNNQYEEVANNSRDYLLNQQKQIERIEQIFSKNELTVNQAEIIALLNYIETKEEGKCPMNTDAQAIVDQSEYKDKLVTVIDDIQTALTEKQIVPTELQWTILINHLNEMLRRSDSGEKIPEVDPAMFAEISPEALEIAAEVVTSISNLPEDELYVLSIHFEAAKQNEQ